MVMREANSQSIEAPLSTEKAFVGSECEILVLSRNLPPLVGGIERLMTHVCTELARDFDLAVVGPLGSREFLPPCVQVEECRAVPVDDFVACCDANALAFAKEKCFQVVLCGTAITARIAQKIARLHGSRLGCFLHGRELVANTLEDWIPTVETLRSFDVLIANSGYTRNLAISLGFDQRRIEVLNPGVGPLDLDTVGYGKHSEEFRRWLGNEASPVLLSVGRLIARKGLLQFIGKCLPEIVRAHPRAVLAIIGGEPANSVFPETGYAAKLWGVAEMHGMQSNVRMLGHVPDAILRAAYSESTLHVFPVVQKEMDVEGFGMVALEAAFHGLPTVAFDVQGVSDAVVHGTTGYLVQPNDYEAFTLAILNHLDGIESSVSAVKCAEHAGTRDWQHFGWNLRNICRCLQNLE